MTKQRVTLNLVAAYCDKAALRNQKKLERALEKDCDLAVEAEVRARLKERLKYAAVCRAAQLVADAARSLLDNGGPKAVDSYAELLRAVRALDKAERGDV